MRLECQPRIKNHSQIFGSWTFSDNAAISHTQVLRWVSIFYQRSCCSNLHPELYLLNKSGTMKEPSPGCWYASPSGEEVGSGQCCWRTNSNDVRSEWAMISSSLTTLVKAVSVEWPKRPKARSKFVKHIVVGQVGCQLVSHSSFN